MSNTNPLFGGSKMMGVCYGPYHQAVSVPKSSYTKTDIDDDLATTAQYFPFIRTYTVQYNQKYLPELCDKNGLGLALGAWIFQGDSASTETEIDTALKEASKYPDTVKVIVVGNEVDLPGNNFSYNEVESALDYAKTQKANYPSLVKTPITVCMTGTGPSKGTWSPLLAKMDDYAFLTIYPYYGQSSPTPSDIAGNMQWSYDHGMKQAEDAGLTVVIAEIGWPSDGNPAKGTSWANEVTNFNATCSWINGTNIYNKAYITMWFEMFNEPWKAINPATGNPDWPWEANFGIYGSGVSPVMKSATGVTFNTCS